MSALTATLTRILRGPEPDPAVDVDVVAAERAREQRLAQDHIDALADKLRQQQIQRGRAYIGALEDAMATCKRAVQVWDAEVRDVALAPEHINQLPTGVWDAVNKFELETRAVLAALGVAAEAGWAVQEGAS